MAKNKCLIVLAILALSGMVYLVSGVISVWAAPPANDDFDNAMVIPGLTYSDSMDTSAATMAADDPGFGCYNAQTNSVWYSFTPTYDMIIRTDTDGSSYSTSIGVFTGSRGSLTPIASNCSSGSVSMNVTTGVTYYFMINGLGGGPYPPETGGGTLVFNISEIPAAPNDNFANATAISTVPFSDEIDTNWATTEAGEPIPSCSGGSIDKTIWYVFTPASSALYTAYFANGGGSTALAVYKSVSGNELIEVGCATAGWGWGNVTSQMEAGTTYYFQTFIQWSYWGTSIYFRLELTPPPNANFYYWPGDPNVYENIQFNNYSDDPVGQSFQSSAWDFGDGTTSTEWSPVHRYAADGDYTVTLTVTMNDGRTATTSNQVQVRTHDITITRFIVPQSARAGQTRQISVDLNNKRYPATVEVQLYKSTQSGYVLVGTLTQYVPIRPANRTTNFSFSYTFTSADASLGKVTFRAVAVLVGARDALPADNEVIALPTKVY